jgi:hypothetical protein
VSIAFRFGYQYRITPIDIGESSRQTSSYVYYERDKQLSGFGLPVSIAITIKKIETEFYFTNVLRYDHIYFKPAPAGSNIGEERKGIITDYEIGVKKLMKKSNILLGLGTAFRNNGTTYTIQEVIGYDPGGNPIYGVSNDNFYFATLDLITGYKFQNFNIELITSYNSENNFIPDNGILLLTLRLSYSFHIN